MRNLQKLVSGYKAFLQNDLPIEQEHFRNLAEHGQSPKIMVIGCCDSRVNPDLIFNTKPGDLFVVRNVANLVPPYEPDDQHHSTSAAIEFAVTGLHIEHIVVLGHSYCGGVKACCDQIDGKKVGGEFIPKWTSILGSCAARIMHETPNIAKEDIAHRVERAAIKVSLDNLKSFPFVEQAIKDRDLQLHGAYFDIREAQLYALDKETHRFKPVE